MVDEARARSAAEARAGSAAGVSAPVAPDAAADRGAAHGRATAPWRRGQRGHAIRGVAGVFDARRSGPLRSGCAARLGDAHLAARRAPERDGRAARQPRPASASLVPPWAIRFEPATRPEPDWSG